MHKISCVNRRAGLGVKLITEQKILFFLARIIAQHCTKAHKVLSSFCHSSHSHSSY